MCQLIGSVSWQIYLATGYVVLHNAHILRQSCSETNCLKLIGYVSINCNFLVISVGLGVYFCKILDLCLFLNYEM